LDCTGAGTQPFLAKGDVISHCISWTAHVSRYASLSIYCATPAIVQSNRNSTQSEAPAKKPSSETRDPGLSAIQKTTCIGRPHRCIPILPQQEQRWVVEVNDRTVAGVEVHQRRAQLASHRSGAILKRSHFRLPAHNSHSRILAHDLLSTFFVTIELGHGETLMGKGSHGQGGRLQDRTKPPHVYNHYGPSSGGRRVRRRELHQLRSSIQGQLEHAWR
jgi:hypothetical protein